MPMTMNMEIAPQDVIAEKGKFLDETNILGDIAIETEAQGIEKLSDEDLFARVEDILLEKIKQGEKTAYFQLGIFYFEQGIYDKAKKFFDRSKDFDFQSLYQLAVMLYDGCGVEPNTKLAVEYLNRVASSDSSHVKHLKHAAQFNIGRAHFQGYGVKRQSDKEAEKWWLLAANDGHPNASIKAQTTLGMFFSREECLDLQKSFFWHSEACGNGSLESQGVLGVMYEHSIGIKYNQDSAYICLKEASDRGNVYAMGNLIAHYYQRKLFTKAADLATKVAELSDIETLAQATECLPAYIKKGLALANFYKARCLHVGHGMERNVQKAFPYYSRCYQFDPDLCATLQKLTQHGVI